MKTDRFLRLAGLLLLLAAGSCTKDSTTPGGGSGGGGSKSDQAYNRKIDAYLQERYLWNGEYKQLGRDLSEVYTADGDNFLLTTLMKMSTNDLDKKPYLGSDGKTHYSLFSYISRTAGSKKSTARATRGVDNGVEKELTYGFGFANLEGVRFVDASGHDTGNYGFICTAVYPDSPASEAGFARGTIIAKANDKPITATTLNDIYATLLQPDGAETLTLTKNEAGAKPVSLTALELCPNPVLHSEVIREGTNRIGYLVYNEFDAAYDDEVLAAVGSFRNEGITDLILDLRYNHGGHVVSSNMLSSCIAGAACENRVFQYYRYNDARMANIGQTSAESGHSYDSSAKKFCERFTYGDYYGVDLRTYALNLTRLFVLVTESTASSSEALINALRGIGIEVTLVGSQTTGKNVGMEVHSFTSGDYSYELVPITFQGYNARQTTVPAAGFAVEYPIDETAYEIVDFGAGDPLVDKAMSLITGRTASVRKTRGAQNAPYGQPEILREVELPQPASRLHGMLVLPPQASGE